MLNVDSLRTQQLFLYRPDMLRLVNDASGMWVASKCGKDLGMAGVKDPTGNFAAKERMLWHEFKSRCAEWEP